MIKNKEIPLSKKARESLQRGIKQFKKGELSDLDPKFYAPKARELKIRSATKEMLNGLSKVQDVTQTMRAFNALDKKPNARAVKKRMTPR